MSVSLYAYVGKGWARCKKCRETIGKGKKGVSLEGYRTSSKYCIKCVRGMLK